MKDLTFIRQEDIASIPLKAVSWEISGVDHKDISGKNSALIGRLGELLDARNMSARKLSIAIGANVTYVAQILNGRGGTPSSARLRQMAEALGTTTDYLVGTASDPGQPLSEVSFHEPPQGWRGAGGDGIPLLGTAYCDDLAVIDEMGGELQIERVQLETDHVVRMIERPAALFAARDAYAIYFHGSSMEPRYYQGEIGIVDPRQPPGPGDFVVVQLTDGESDDVVTVLVKQLVRVARDFLELRQFNPDQTFQIPRNKVARMHRIISMADLVTR